MKAAKVHLGNEDHFNSSINGTYKEIYNYYHGNTFNMGTVGDDMQECIKVEFLTFEEVDKEQFENLEYDLIGEIKYKDFSIRMDQEEKRPNSYFWHYIFDKENGRYFKMVAGLLADKVEIIKDYVFCLMVHDTGEDILGKEGNTPSVELERLGIKTIHNKEDYRKSKLLINGKEIPRPRPENLYPILKENKIDSPYFYHYYKSYRT